MEDPRETSLVSLAVIAFAVAVAMMGYLVVHSPEFSGGYSTATGIGANR